MAKRDPLDLKNLFNQLVPIKPLPLKDVLLLRFPGHVNASLIGLAILPVFKYLKFHVGKEGCEYYGEVHKSKFNCYMHTLGMPFTIYGITQWLPTLFLLSPKHCVKFIRNLFFLYLTHYLSVDWKVAALYSIIYAPVVIISSMQHYYGRPEQRFMRGLFISTAALVFQEGLGHWWGGDKPSRLEAVPNAILYAKFFSLQHLLKGA
jgi:hypothetical protein